MNVCLIKIVFVKTTCTDEEGEETKEGNGAMEQESDSEDEVEDEVEDEDEGGDVVPGDAVNTAITAAELGLLLPEFEEGTRVRLRRYDEYSDAVYLQRPLEIHGVIISKGGATKRSTVFNVKWFTGKSNPMFHEPAVAYNAVRLYSLTRLQHGEDGY